MLRALLLAALITPHFPLRAESAPQNPIAVVNVAEVLHHYPPVITAKQALKRRKEDLQTTLQQLDATGKAIKEKLSLMNPRNPKFSEEYSRLQLELTLIPSRMNFIGKSGEQELADLYTQVLSDARRSLLTLMKTFGDEQGYRLILATPDTSIVAETPSQIDLLISLQSVLYAHPSIDVTKPFLAFLNSKLPAGEATPKATTTEPASVPAPPAQHQP